MTELVRRQPTAWGRGLAVLGSVGLVAVCVAGAAALTLQSLQTVAGLRVSGMALRASKGWRVAVGSRWRCGTP